MKRRTVLQAALGLGGLAGLGGLGGMATLSWRAGNRGTQAPLSTQLQWHERPLRGLGTTMLLRVAHRDPEQAGRALDAVVATIGHVEAHMNLFDPDSAISRLNRDGELFDPDPHLLAILRLAQHVSQRSSGAFDVTVQPLWQAFAAAQSKTALPLPAAVLQARAQVGWQGLLLAPERISFARPGMGITLNGIAQGYCADLVRARLKACGIEHALINTGEWSALGQPLRLGEPGWTLGIANPRDESRLIASVLMDGRSMASSADNQTTFSSDFRHHHIFDPHTGYSPLELASVTVVCASCALADALTKVMFVAGMERSLVLAQQWQADVLLVDKAGLWRASPGLKLMATGQNS